MPTYWTAVELSVDSLKKFLFLDVTGAYSTPWKMYKLCVCPRMICCHVCDKYKNATVSSSCCSETKVAVIGHVDDRAHTLCDVTPASSISSAFLTYSRC